MGLRSLASVAPKSEHRFVFLDGLRGLAALCVAIFHAALSFHLDYLPKHAVLAVDFFFCLSGFVLAFAYDKKFLTGMSARNFMLSRVIRLYPMIFLSVLFGGALLIGENVSAGLPIAHGALLTIASLFLFPLGLVYGMQAFPPNDPLWSLFFEFVANAAYGLVGKRASTLVALTGLLVFALVLVHAVRVAHGIAEIGFSNVKLFCFGCARVAVPFSAGVMLFRLGSHKSISPVLFGSTVVFGLLLMLLNTASISSIVSYDLACVLIVIPALVHVGARIQVSGTISRLCSWGGAISYPFYLIHGPMMNLVNSFSSRVGIDHPYLSASVTVLVAGLVSYIALHFYDIPLRARLSRWQRQTGTNSLLQKQMSAD